MRRNIGNRKVTFNAGLCRFLDRCVKRVSCCAGPLTHVVSDFKTYDLHLHDNTTSMFFGGSVFNCPN